MAVVTMRQLLESGVHFGHQTRRWNPKMKRFILTDRNGIYIIDLQQSLSYIDTSFAFIKDTVAKGGTIMFVGTKKQAQQAIAEQATRVGMPYVNQRWLGGMLTNFQTVHQRINRLKELDELDFDNVAGSGRTKKELLQMKREQIKLDKTLGGIRDMGRTPNAVWIVDTNKEHLAVEEARKLKIPIIAILDSNCDPDLVDYPIPGNDDAIRAVGLLTRVVADAVAEGLIARSGARTEGEAGVATDEPLADWERELLAGDADKAAVAATGGDTATEETPAAAATGAASEGAESVEAAAEVEEAPAATETVVAEPEVAETAEVETPTPVAKKAPVKKAAAKTAEAATEEPADAAGDAAADEAPFGPDSAKAAEDGSGPDGFEIKGNADSMKFHGPTSPWYDRTKAEVWFKTTEAAEAAGFVNAQKTDDTAKD
ncbi:MAG: ribosomal protein [Nocardioidaceae bacterium]|nr:ribosomal protein [Nocardioidaceae bacterium]